MTETTEKLQKNELTGKARSRANLIPWNKGQSGNPKNKNLIGAPKTLSRLKSCPQKHGRKMGKQMNRK